MDYDITDPQSIADYADGLIGKTLRQAANIDGHKLQSVNKGKLGNLVEELYFKIRPDNLSGLPDFEEAGVELKTTGVKRLKNGQLRPKERLVLSMISYDAIVNESWERNSLMAKCQLMLILFYQYQKGLTAIDRRFLAKKLWEFPVEDLVRIRKDWQIIAEKVRNGRAHELSEGDTWYLGACTKSSNSKKRTSQPNSNVPAKPRAFSLKPSYVQTILDSTTAHENYIEPSKQDNIEEILLSKTSKYVGRYVDDLLSELRPKIKTTAKSKKSILALAMLGHKTRHIPELQKADIYVKVVTIAKSGSTSKESMSFPAFKYLEIVDQDWDSSSFSNYIEKRFFFVVFREDESGIKFIGSKFWTMPYEDRVEAEKVWHKTVELIERGEVDSLPGSKDSRVAHVRPHGKNARDTLPAPDGNHYPKKSFWLNAKYIKAQVEELI